MNISASEFEMRRREMWMDIRAVHFRPAWACEMVFLKAFRFTSNVPGRRESGNIFARVWVRNECSLGDLARMMVCPPLNGSLRAVADFWHSSSSLRFLT